MSGTTSAVGAMSRGAEAAAGAAAKGTEFSAGVTKDLGSLAEKVSMQSDRFMPSLNKDIFSNTTPATIFADFQDRPVFSASILKDMTVLASNKPLGKGEPVKEMVVFENPAKIEDVETSQIVNAPAQSPAVQIQEELALATNVRNLLLEIGVNKKEAVRISEQSLAQALERKLKKKTLKKEEEIEEETENESKPPVKEDKDQPVNFVRDEFADDARRKDGQKAIQEAFGKAAETEEEVDGADITENMNQVPSEDEVSEIALRHGQKQDGSYSEILNEMKKSSFTSKEEAKAKLEELISQKPAVTKGKGKTVGEEDVRRVLTLKSFRNPFLDFLTKFVRN